MELFYTANISGDRAVLDSEESAHCIKVLRHREGDRISVIDGSGSLLDCRIEKCGRQETILEIMGREENFGGHDYDLEMAVAPTKNMERYEWFMEKATEIGVDSIVPVICDRSERRAVKEERGGRLLLSAAKQSLKGRVPGLSGCVPVLDYISSCDSGRLRLIACCSEAAGAEKCSVAQAVESSGGKKAISILIGPEGDFSPQEVEAALSHGFMPVHLGRSRLRTETAAVVACCSIYNLLG